MTALRLWILAALMLVLCINLAMLLIGAYWGHNGLFEFGAEVGKVIFGTVVGALVTVFSEK
jgi:hypothetical protein